MKQTAIILNRRDYEFNDDKTGELIQGSNIMYLVQGENEPLQLKVNSYAKNQNLLNVIVEFPAVYDLVLETEIKGGQMVLKIVGAEFKKKIDLFKGI